MLLSVIIPTRNRAHYLPRLIGSLLKQNPVPFEWEVIVVDNASSDATAATVNRFQDSSAVSIRYVHEPRIGLVYGRHRGANEAKGVILGYLDDDMHLSPDWIMGHERISRGHGDAVVGRILPEWETDPPDWFTYLQNGGLLSYLGLLDLGPSERAVAPKYVFGGNCFLPKHLVFSLGGFHPDGVPISQLRYRGDGETGLMAKFESAGLKSYYDPRATAYHIIGPARLTIEYFCSRAFNQGISDSYTHLREDRRELYWRAFLKQFKSIRDRMSGNRVMAQIRKAYWEGYQFHQREVKADPDLYKWVKKESYFS